MVDLRSDLIESRSKNAVLEKELQNTLEQLHAAQLQVHATSGHVPTAESVRKKLVGCRKFIYDRHYFSLLGVLSIQTVWELCSLCNFVVDVIVVDI